MNAEDQIQKLKEENAKLRKRATYFRSKLVKIRTLSNVGLGNSKLNSIYMVANHALKSGGDR